MATDGRWLDKGGVYICEASDKLKDISRVLQTYWWIKWYVIKSLKLILMIVLMIQCERFLLYMIFK